MMAGLTETDVEHPRLNSSFKISLAKYQLNCKQYKF